MNIRLIDAEALKKRAIRVSTVKEHCYMKAIGTHEIDKAPTVDAVPLEVWKQTAWERDIAIKQLEEYGIPFGGVAPDVVEVVRCKNCEYWSKATVHKGFLICPASGMEIMEDDYCSYGERGVVNA